MSVYKVVSDFLSGSARKSSTMTLKDRGSPIYDAAGQLCPTLNGNKKQSIAAF